MTKEEAANLLNGCEYRSEGSPELFSTMAESGLVAVFGASDDLMEFRGAIDDEAGVWDGSTVGISMQGPSPVGTNVGDPTTITAWFERDGYSWTYETDRPHVCFDVLEDGVPYCKGIVISLSDSV